MRFDRDQIDRGSVFDRAGGISALVTLTAYLDTDSGVYAAMGAISRLLASYPDTNSDVYAAIETLTRLLSAYTDSDSGVYARLRLDHLMAAYADTDSDIDAKLRVSALLSALLDTDSDIYGIIQMGPLHSTINTNSDIYALIRMISSWTFTYSGSVGVGKTLCIDGDKFKITLDGVNSFVDFTGEYPSIHPGTNWIIYSDSEGARTISLVVSKKDRNM